MHQYILHYANWILISTSFTAPPAYKPDDHAPSPIFTITAADPSNGRHTNKDINELPPSYDEAIVIGRNVDLSRRDW